MNEKKGQRVARLADFRSFNALPLGSGSDVSWTGTRRVSIRCGKRETAQFTHSNGFLNGNFDAMRRTLISAVVRSPALSEHNVQPIQCMHCLTQWIIYVFGKVRREAVYHFSIIRISRFQRDPFSQLTVGDTWNMHDILLLFEWRVKLTSMNVKAKHTRATHAFVAPDRITYCSFIDIPFLVNIFFRSIDCSVCRQFVATFYYEILIRKHTVHGVHSICRTNRIIIFPRILIQSCYTFTFTTTYHTRLARIA